MERYYSNMYDTDLVMMRQEVIWTRQNGAGTRSNTPLKIKGEKKQE